MEIIVQFDSIPCCSHLVVNPSVFAAGMDNEQTKDTSKDLAVFSFDKFHKNKDIMKDLIAELYVYHAAIVSTDGAPGPQVEVEGTAEYDQTLKKKAMKIQISNYGKICHDDHIEKARRVW